MTVCFQTCCFWNCGRGNRDLVVEKRKICRDGVSSGCGRESAAAALTGGSVLTEVEDAKSHRRAAA